MNYNQSIEIKQKIAQNHRLVMDRRILGANCMMDYAVSESVNYSRHHTTAEYTTPDEIIEQWALSWGKLSII